MRFAGDMFKEPMSESRRSYEGIIDKPVVPGFNTEDLMPTPELPAGNPFNQNGKGRYIQQVPGSGISSIEPATEVANLFNPMSWFNGKNQEDIDKMNSGSKEKIEQRGISGAIMNRNRELNQLMNELQ